MSPESQGLTEVEANERLARDGANEPIVRARWSLPREVGRRIASPLVAILVLSSLAAAALGDLADASVILVIVIVVLVIRTPKSAFSSRPSMALVVATLTVVVIGVLLPFSPIAPWLGFTPLPARFFLFLVPAVVTYLGLVELVKRRLYRHTF